MKKRLLFCLIAFALLFGYENSRAATITFNWTGAVSTDWTNPSNWNASSGSGNYPGHAASDIVIIGNGTAFTNNPVLNTSVTFKTLTIGDGTTTPLVTINAALNVTGAITVNSGTITSNPGGTISGGNSMDFAGTLNLGDQLSVSATFTVEDGSAITSISGATISAAKLFITGSTLTLGDNVTVTGTAATALEFISGTSTGTIAVNGATTPSINENAGGGLTIGENMVLNVPIVSTGAISISTGNSITTTVGGSITAGNLTSNGTVTLGVPVNVGTTKIATGGTLNLNAALTGSGDITVMAGSTLTANSSGAITVPDISINSSTVTFGGVFTLSGDITIAGNNTTSTIITNAAGNTMNNLTISGTTAILNLNGSGTTAATGALTMSAKSDVNIGSGNSITFGSVSTTAGAATNTTALTNAGTVLCTGTISLVNYCTISNSGTFNLGPASIIDLNGNTSTTVTNTGTFTLMSGASSSATVGAITGGSFSGSFSVQRFITGGNISYRGYRLLSSAVSDPSSSPAGAYYNLSYLIGSGTYLTGAAGGGFDATGNPTIYLYNEGAVPDNSSFTTGNYRAVTAINNSPAYTLGTIDGNHNMPVGNGFMFFYRGNNSTNASVVPSSLVFSSPGSLNQGQITVSTWNNTNGATFLNFSDAPGMANAAVKGFNLVGNPYASTIDWGTFNTTSSTTGIYAPTGTVGTTIYTINPSSHVYATYIQGGGSTNGGSQYIASGQGFFVQATASGAQLIFNESAKASVQPTTLLLNSTLVAIADQHLRLKLVQDSVNAEDIYLGFRANASSAYVFNEDAPYLVGNGTVSLSSSSSDNHQLAINFQPLPKQSLVIPLNTNVNDFGIFKMNLTEAVGIPPVYDIWLQDTYLKDSLDIRHNPIYSFSVTTDPASYNHSRFNLVIRQNPALAVHLLSFAGVKETDDIKLDWTVENESNYTHYTLEKSTDGGKSFVMIDSLTSAALGTYTDLDPHPITGANLYRLEQIDVLGNITYSKIITVIYVPTISSIIASLISIYPNPVSTILNLSITQSGNTKGAYAITIVNSTGTIVKKTTSAQPEWQADVSGFFPGTYFIEVLNTANNQLVGKSSFSKK